MVPINGSLYGAVWYLPSVGTKANETAAEAPLTEAASAASTQADATNALTASLATDTVSISSQARAQLDASSQADTTDSNGATNVVPVESASPHYAKTVQLADGKQVVQLGDVDAGKAYFHKQGQNDYGYQGTCGLVSVGDVINQFGNPVTENDVVHYAVDHKLCNVVAGQPTASGGTTMVDQSKILTGMGTPAHIELGDTLEGLGRDLEEGHGVIIAVNAGELWNRSSYYDNGAPNHAVTLTGVAADPNTGKTVGVWVNDSGAGNYQRYLPVDHPAIKNWKENGEPAVVTDQEHS
jgi:hypothetical protein